MRRLYSLIKACLTNDMSIFKINTKKKNKFSSLAPILISLYLMFMIWCSANTIFEKLKPFNLQYIVLSLSIISISAMTLIEGVYKSSALIFNCKDDILLLSLPIKKRTILFIRILKFYIFELLFNSMFLLPFMIAYIRWGLNITWTYYLTCFTMLLLSPIIPIIVSCIIGIIIANISSYFKYKNLVQIIISMSLILGILLLSFNSETILNYIIKNATNINDLITKIYYPAGVFSSLVTNFKTSELLLFILINIIAFIISLFILSKFYFKINSRLKNVIVSKKNKNIKSLNIEKKSQTRALIKKELNTFFSTPVFIINAGFALVLFLILAVIISLKSDYIINLLVDKNRGLGISKNIINNNISIFIYILISLTAYMTSITNSSISLEGKNIQIIKSLPIKSKTILQSKILAPLIITTPIFIIGDLILIIKLKIKILEAILLLILSILIPLVSHYIGLIVNLKYPKFDWENTSEVVKQSMSSFIAVTIGMVLFIISYITITKFIGHISSISILIISIIAYIIIDIMLHIYIVTRGSKIFNKLNSY